MLSADYISRHFMPPKRRKVFKMKLAWRKLMPYIPSYPLSMAEIAWALFTL